jgi:ubiquinone/menaquinone biosynthesis C-methylase UbiE
MQNRARSDEEEELKRLLIHDQIFTTSMGGVLPEQADPTRFARVLDIGCGPGSWLIEAARTYPTMSLLIGVDISHKMIGYANKQARAQHVDGRVEFRQMDVLKRFEFPAEFFDLVNERFGTGWLRTWEWPAFLQECQRVTRPGGVIRITEFNVNVESTSPALTRLGELAVAAFNLSGHLFTPGSDGVTKELAHVLSRYGIRDVQTRAYALEHRADTPEGQLFVEDWRRIYRGIVPFLQQWIRVPDNYEDIYRQMLHETQRKDFVATSHILTAWGTRSPDFSLPDEV